MYRCVCDSSAFRCSPYSFQRSVNRADPRLLRALRKTVSTGGEVRNEWMKRICLCFTPPWIRLAESARETVSLPRLAMLSTCFFRLEQETLGHSRYKIWLIFYVERRQHRITINYHSCCHSRLAKFKTKPKWNYLWEQGPLVFRGPYSSSCILRIGRIGSEYNIH